MPSFSYVAVNRLGKRIKDNLDASSMETAKNSLRAAGYTIIEIKELGVLDRDIEIPFLGNPTAKDMAIFCRQFQSILRAGVPVTVVLSMLGQQTENKKLAVAIRDMQASIEKGETLAGSMRKHPKIFSSMLVNMIAAGEESGRLDEVMERLAEHFQKAAKLKNKISSAMVYPKILAFVTVSVSWGLLTFLVPSITQTIADLGGELPGLTKAIIAVSDSLTHYWYVYLIVVGAAVAGFNLWRASAKGQYQWAWLMIHMPIIGPMTKMTATAQFTRTVSTLLKSGISILQAVEITEKSLDNVILEKKLADARLEIRKGAALSKSIKNIEEFPPMVYAMTAIGEESGTLDTILEKAADYFEDEADAATSKMTAALEPIMIIVMAIVVGLIVGGIAIPIFNMASYI